MTTYGTNFCEWWEIWREFEKAISVLYRIAILQYRIVLQIMVW